MIKSIILALSVAAFIIAVHQTFIYGFHESYWLFMISVSLLLLSRLLKAGNLLREKEEMKKKKSAKASKGKKRS